MINKGKEWKKLSEGGWQGLKKVDKWMMKLIYHVAGSVSTSNGFFHQSWQREKLKWNKRWKNFLFTWRLQIVDVGLSRSLVHENKRGNFSWKWNPINYCHVQNYLSNKSESSSPLINENVRIVIVRFIARPTRPAHWQQSVKLANYTTKLLTILTC